MRSQRNTASGYYMPGFLRMQVETHSSLLDLNQLPDTVTESVYLHEYCHFIQNVATINGLRHFYLVVNYLKYATNYVHALPPGNFEVPVNAVAGAPDNVEANWDLWQVYAGSGEQEEAALTGHCLLHTERHGRRVPLVEVSYRTPLGAEDIFFFGELCISESMAYLIERSCYPADCPPSPDLPYRAAEKLVELVFPAFGQDPLNVLALCDASLRAFNPGPFFYETLLYIRDNQVPVAAPEDIYAICSQATFEFDGATAPQVLLASTAEGAIAQLHDYFNDKRFDAVKVWLAGIIRAALAFRQQHETFPLAIARGGPITRNHALAAFMRSAGTPLTVNLAHEVSLADPRHPDAMPPYGIIWAIEEILGVLTSANKCACNLVHYCRTSKVPVDRRCSTAPWQRTEELACAFGTMWRHWGMAGHSPAP